MDARAARSSTEDAGARAGAAPLETDLHQAMAREEFQSSTSRSFDLESDGSGLRGRCSGGASRTRLIPPRSSSAGRGDRSHRAAGERIFNEACRRLPALARSRSEIRGLTLAVNLSLRQVYSPNLEEERSWRWVGEAGLDPTLLHFEITETPGSSTGAGETRVLLRLKRRASRSPSTISGPGTPRWPRSRGSDEPLERS